MLQAARCGEPSHFSDNDIMTDETLTYFREKLIGWREQLLAESTETIFEMQEKSNQEPDVIDFACNEVARSLELRTRDRERKLVNKINDALMRIEDGSYGYCEETGEPISLKRLDARPIATLSIEAQERHERRERTYRDEVM
ncbi:MAG: RNA polymerase-binding protein DksA [Candidatus Paracaedibacteraceae bacterium]|nr:RNA polymerase-binding protein DksA [Candidatus Paracaedibacteraceae bacterium]